MMKVIALTICFFMSFLSGYTQSFKQKSFDLMVDNLVSHSLNEVKSNDIKDDTTVVYIDAREKREYDISHIKGAVWVGYDEFDKSRLEGLDKAKKVVVYCSIGYRSEKIGEQLKDAGFKDVSNLIGGIFDWTNKELPVVDSLGNSTNKVHAFSKVWGVWVDKAEKVY